MNKYNQELSQYFRVDETSPSGLVKIVNNVGKPVKGFNIGSKRLQTNGQPRGWDLHFHEKMYRVHRIIWVLTYGSIDVNLVIDHLDGNPFNNNIKNLALKTTADNTRNRRQHGNNTSGLVGVNLTTNLQGRHYRAHWCELDGKQKYKYFSVNKFGEDNAKNLAAKYREQQIQRLLEEGADYTERHGI